MKLLQTSKFYQIILEVFGDTVYMAWCVTLIAITDKSGFFSANIDHSIWKTAHAGSCCFHDHYVNNSGRMIKVTKIILNSQIMKIVSKFSIELILIYVYFLQSFI